MHSLLERITQLPLFLGVSIMFAIVFFRSQIIYWLARGGAQWIENYSANKDTGIMKRINKAITGASVQKGVNAIDRWGIIIIPLSYLTWGFQTIVNAGAGVMRIPWILYTLVALPGYLAWAIIYTTIGVVIIAAVGAMSLQTIIFGIGTVIVGLLCLLYIKQRRTRVSNK